MPDSIANVTTSPRLAAIGVAILSGLILNRLAEIIIMITTVPLKKSIWNHEKRPFILEKKTRIPSKRLAKLAVVTLELTSVRICSVLTSPSRIKLVMHATKEARKPTTIDWS